MKKRSAANPSSKKKRRTFATGGGNATAAGVNFQQNVGAVVGTLILTEQLIDPRFGLGSPKAISMRFETEAPLDDILVETSNHGYLAMQAKGALSSSRTLTSEYGKTVEQIVRHWLLCRDGSGDKGWNRLLDPERDRLVITVGPDSPATIRQHLARGLEARRQIGPTVLTMAETKALADFDACLVQAWTGAATEPLTDVVIREISRLTFVFTIDPSGPERSSLGASLAPVLANPADGAATLQLLERVSGDLMSARGGVDVSGLRRDLLGRGAKLSPRPDYRADIAVLKAYTEQVEKTLRAYEVVEAESGHLIGIERHCQVAVNVAAHDGPLLLIGEPGAGKSAVMNALGRALKAQGHDVVELAVDRFSVESLEGLSAVLKLQHVLTDVLEAWDGARSGFLLTDALDASRGGPGEAAFKRLIEQVVEGSGRWIVIASIRTFDLRMGHAYRALFKGVPPNSGTRDESFTTVRHVHVPSWTREEFDELLALSPKLAEVLRGSPDKLRELAMVPFNTRLLADLIASGAVGEDLNKIDSQIALMNLYWEWRVEGHGLPAEVCLRGVLSAMVARRALRARRLDVAQQDPKMLETLIANGVLVPIDQERSVQFRHHLLFDYAASRLFLDVDAIVAGQASFPKADGLGLVLAPALAFLLTSLWPADHDHDRFWIAVSRLLGSDDCDPIIRGIVARMAAEMPKEAEDILPLARRVVGGDAAALTALQHITGALAVRLEDEASVPLASWIRLARELAVCPAPVALILRLLGFLLVERVTDRQQREDLGFAFRALLAHGLTLDDSRSVAVPCIGFVADTYSTDPAASKALLVQVFDSSRFDRFGSQEVPMLTRKIAQIAEAAPDFAAYIYREVYAHTVNDTGQTSMGPSKILHLTSNAQQDYETSRYLLGEYFSTFLALAPIEATRGFLGAMEGHVARAHRIPEHLLPTEAEGPEGAVQIQPDYSHIWAHETNPQHAQDGEALLSKFAAFLRTGPEAAALEAANQAIVHAHLAVIWSRLFMAATERGGQMARLLWPYAWRDAFLMTSDTRKDAVDLVAADYPNRAIEERIALEVWALEVTFSDYAEPAVSRELFLKRLFGAIGHEHLATTEAQAFLDAHPPDGETNRRLFELSGGWRASDHYPWLDNEAKAQPGNARLIEAVDAVTATLHLGPNDKTDPADLDSATQALRSLATKIGAAIADNETLVQRAEGILAQGVQKLVNSRRISNETHSDVIDALAAMIERCAGSSAPKVNAETEAEFEQSCGWGSPAARIHAAEASLDLCLKRPEVYTRFAPLIDTLLTDPHPAVRLNAALRLVRIWDIDRAGFWRRARAIIAREDNRSVLNGFVADTIGKVMWAGSAVEVADLILPLLDRLPATDARNAGIRAHLVQMTALLWMRFDHKDARRRVEDWLAASVDNSAAVREIMRLMQRDLTAGLRGDDSVAADRVRALGFMSRAVEVASNALASYRSLDALSEAQIERARGAVQIVDTTCQLLYFASGAFQSQSGENAPSAMTASGRHTFLLEIAPTLRRIGEHGGAHTIYYQIQLLEHLVEADPPFVFDLIAHALLHGGRDGDYQFESLGADLIVRLIAGYLADHKEIFDKPERRQALIDCLETFLAAGWPSIRRLLYRLPELIQ